MDLIEVMNNVTELEQIRHFDHETVEDKKECFKAESIEFIDALEGNGDIAEEGADVIHSVMMVFKREKIDPNVALKNKYEKDKLRV